MFRPDLDGGGNPHVPVFNPADAPRYFAPDASAAKHGSPGQPVHYVAQGPISAPAVATHSEDYFSLPAEVYGGNPSAGSAAQNIPYNIPPHLHQRKRRSFSAKMRHRLNLLRLYTNDDHVELLFEPEPLAPSTPGAPQHGAAKKSKPRFHLKLDNLKNSSAFGSPHLDSALSHIRTADSDRSELDLGPENVTPLMFPPNTVEQGYFGDFETGSDAVGGYLNVHPHMETLAAGSGNSDNSDIENYLNLQVDDYNFSMPFDDDKVDARFVPIFDSLDYQLYAFDKNGQDQHTHQPVHPPERENDHSSGIPTLRSVPGAIQPHQHHIYAEEPNLHDHGQRQPLAHHEPHHLHSQHPQELAHLRPHLSNSGTPQLPSDHPTHHTEHQHGHQHQHPDPPHGHPHPELPHPEHPHGQQHHHLNTHSDHVDAQNAHHYVDQHHPDQMDFHDHDKFNDPAYHDYLQGSFHDTRQEYGQEEGPASPRPETDNPESDAKIIQNKKKKSVKGTVCSICDRYISRDFSRHMRIHDGAGRFQCVFPPGSCKHKSRKFNRPYDFKKHLLNMHFKFDDPAARLAPNLTEKLMVPGQCIACGQSFIANDWLDKHILIKDPIRRCVGLQRIEQLYKDEDRTDILSAEEPMSS